MAVVYTPRNVHVNSEDGTRIYAEALGDPAKQSIVFIHGGLLSSVVFDPIFDDTRWTDRLYLIRYDVRGHGRSDKPTDDASWMSRRLAEDFDAVIREFNVVRPFVVGWSLGATYITDVLSLHPPSYLAGIVDINGTPYLGPIFPRVITPAIAEVLPNLLQTTDVDAYQKWAQRFIDLCADDMPHHLRQMCLGDVMVLPRAAAKHSLSRSQDATGLLRAIQTFRLPSLVVLSLKDRIIEVKELGLIARELGCKTVELPEADHTPWIRHRDLFRETILSWTDKHSILSRL